MIQKLSIRNFKSVRELDLSCRRVNVFIGEPNAGKTNILEAMGLRCGGCLLHASDVFRCSTLADLFFDQDSKNQIGVGFDESRMIIRVEKDDAVGVHLQAMGGHQAFRISSELIASPNTFNLTDSGKAPEAKVYLFQAQPKLDVQANGCLLPPFGANLLHMLYSSKEVRVSASGLFAPSGFRLNVDYTDKRLRVSKMVDDVLISFPYSTCSETLRRMVFHHLAIDTNESSVLVFDEPEAHAYPPYTKILAEKMAKDDCGNQFFLTTHSPYMLTSLIEKTPVDELNVILCRMENFETKAYVMNEEQKGQLLEWGMSAFYNFDRLVDKES